METHDEGLRVDNEEKHYRLEKEVDNLVGDIIATDAGLRFAFTEVRGT